MQHKRKWFILLALVACVFSIGTALAQEIGAARFTIGNGGGSVSTSNLQVRSSMSQPISGIVRDGESFQLCSGIECGLADASSSTSTPDPAVTPSPSSTSEPVGTPTATGTPPPGSSSDIVISEIYYAGSSSSEDWFELQNVGSGIVDVSDWWLCARFSYKQISDDVEIISGDTNLGPGEIVVLRAWTNLQDTSDFGLYLDNNGAQPPFDSIDFLVDFLQWGTADDVGRSDVAAAKGIWPRTSDDPVQYDFVPTGASNESVALISSNAGSAAVDFDNGTPSQGISNVEPSATPTPPGNSDLDLFLPVTMR